ncbi:MAG: PepSY domain-containing protein, partial [Verrucomicrobiota bacterium]
LQTIRYEDVEPSVKTAAYFYPLHVGSIFGLPTKILATVTCVMIVFMVITGTAMWWVRRPKGRSGFVPLPNRYRWPARWWLAIAACSVIMPLFAASIVIMGLIERSIYWWGKRRA